MKSIELTGIDYYCQVSDVELINKIVREMLPYSPICVNIGAGMGTSALTMLEARFDSHVYSIDIDRCPLEMDTLIRSGVDYKSRYTFIQGRSQDVGKWFTREFADFVFIDGGHTYDECYQDAIVWHKILKRGGIMAFHDYESSIQVLESVKRAVDDVSVFLGLEFIIRKGTMKVFRKAT